MSIDPYAANPEGRPPVDIPTVEVIPEPEVVTHVTTLGEYKYADLVRRIAEDR